ncbi:IS110 family transposase [Natronomonas gomsonensis]|uniref:IS110 family transposase n=1 Tax=Natronomonas gomsonensis TaxID=1046043 RepID=UPI00227D3BC1|nr:IS110 family transposase [Natronomonas gomsonensis]MCY4732994.1 IS110 family transposase [Natronomonas gomsonensis]
MYLGIDTHKRYSQVAVVNGDGNVQEESRLPNDRLEELAEQYTGAEAAIEASGHYRPIYEMLDEHLDVTLVNPSKNRIIADAAVKTDRVDAKRLALMLRADMLAESYVPPDEIRELRDLVRTRKSLVEERTAEKNRVRAVLTRTNNTYDSELFGPTGREFLAELSLSDTDRTIIEAHLSVIDEYDQQIERLEEKIERRVLESPAAQRLLTIPGVGQYTAAVIVAEVGEIERFDEDKQLVSYAGLDPVVHQSGDKEVRGSISKEGSAPLRWALVQCASIAVRCDEYLGNFYTRLKERKNHQIAIVATARKMLVSIFHMLTRKEPYDPPGVSA